MRAEIQEAQGVSTKPGASHWQAYFDVNGDLRDTMVKVTGWSRGKLGEKFQGLFEHLSGNIHDRRRSDDYQVGMENVTVPTALLNREQVLGCAVLLEYHMFPYEILPDFVSLPWNVGVLFRQVGS